MPNPSNASRLLINESPIALLPSLAVAVGVSEAIVLQQVQYWLSINTARGDARSVHDGRVWTYNSVEAWQEQLPFFSRSTVARALASLRERGLLLAAHLAPDARDRTLWYSIDYEAVEALWAAPETSRSDSSERDDPSTQNELMDPVNLSDCFLSETTPETTPKTIEAATAPPPAGDGDPPKRKKAAPKKAAPIYAPDSLEYLGALYLWDTLDAAGSAHVQAVARDGKRETELQRWADVFERIVRLDNATWEEVAEVLAWLRNVDDFWVPKGNLQTAAKLRDKSREGVLWHRAFLTRARTRNSRRPAADAGLFDRMRSRAAASPASDG